MNSTRHWLCIMVVKLLYERRRGKDGLGTCERYVLVDKVSWTLKLNPACRSSVTFDHIGKLITPYPRYVFSFCSVCLLKIWYEELPYAGSEFLLLTFCGIRDGLIKYFPCYCSSFPSPHVLSRTYVASKLCILFYLGLFQVRVLNVRCLFIVVFPVIDDFLFVLKHTLVIFVLRVCFCFMKVIGRTLHKENALHSILQRQWYRYFR
jgi:hypothetical protein